MNNYGNLSDLNLHGRVAEITSNLIEEYARYGVTEADVEALSALNEQFSGSIQIAATAASNAKGTTSTKNSFREDVLASIRQLTRTVYADPDVDDALLNKGGFSPRPVYGTKTSPKQVTGLTATVNQQGQVMLKWDRSENSNSVQFTIWAKGEGGNWTSVASTGRVKITLDGYTPGVFKQFRVTASVNNQTSTASSHVDIYDAPGAGNVNLQIAA